MNKAYLLRNRGEKMEQLMRSIVSLLKESEQGLTGLEIIQSLKEDGKSIGIDIINCLDQAIMKRIIDMEFFKLLLDKNEDGVRYKLGPKAWIYY